MDAIVVGGGIAGLTAAGFLAKAGWRVRLLEAGTKLGGRGQSTAFPGGIINLGPHAFYYGGRGVQVLKELGVVPRGGWAPAHRTVVRDGDHELGLGRSRPGLRALWQFAAATRPGVDYAKLDAVRLGDWIENSIDDEDAARLVRASATIASYCRTDDVCAGAVLRQIARAYRMVQYTHGGWQSVVDALEIAARKLGVAIELDSPVKAVRTGVVTTHSQLATDAVVLCVPASTVETLTGVDLGVRRPVCVATLDVALDADVRDASPTFDLRRGVYLSVHTPTARLAEPGVAVMHSAKYLEPDAPHDAAAARDDVEAVLESVVPDWRSRVRFQRFMPSLTVTDWFPRASAGGLFGRPDVTLDDGIYLAGDWVRSDSMLADGALWTAKEAATRVVAANRRREVG